MRARGWAPASTGSPIGVCVTTSIDLQIAQELAVREEQVAAAVALLDDGATVPFIARYRKEATGALDDTQLRILDERRVDFEYDGDMAADVALNMELREAYPFCRLSGPANVLIMPAIHSAHATSV